MLKTILDRNWYLWSNKFKFWYEKEKKKIIKEKYKENENENTSEQRMKRCCEWWMCLVFFCIGWYYLGIIEIIFYYYFSLWLICLNWFLTYCIFIFLQSGPLMQKTEGKSWIRKWLGEYKSHIFSFIKKKHISNQ